jgi:hypothetical protein
MGFKEKAAKRETDRNQAIQDLENRYPQWQHAASVLNQLIEGYINADTDLKGRLSTETRERHVVDPVLKSRKQLNELVITLREQPKELVSVEALPLSPPILGSAGRFDLKTPRGTNYYVVWDGLGESANNFRFRSSNLDKRVNADSLNEVLGELFVLE